MDFIFEVTDKGDKNVHLSKERWKHILKHPHMNYGQIEDIQSTLKNPITIRYEDKDEVQYNYK